MAHLHRERERDDIVAMTSQRVPGIAGTASNDVIAARDARIRTRSNLGGRVPEFREGDDQASEGTPCFSLEF